MTRYLFAVTCALALAAGIGCATSNSTKPASPAPEEKAPPPAKAEKPRWGSFGFDLTGMDRSVKPGEDWFRYANGHWVESTPIPEDRSRYGMFNVLTEQAREQNRALIEAAAASKAAEGTEAQKVGDFFASFMDEAAIEKLGAAPLKPVLEQIAGIKTAADLARVLGDHLRYARPGPFRMYVDQDSKAPDQYIPIFVQGGLGLPDRDFYLKDDARFVEIREKYVAHVAKMLELAGVPKEQTKAKADGIFGLEKQIATAHWTRVDSRDADKTYNKWPRADFAKKAPGFDWAAFFAAAGLDGQADFIVSQPSAFTGMAALTSRVPLATWRDYLTLHATKDLAPFLSKAFVDEDFAFDGTVLRGQPQLQARWERGVDYVSAALGEAVGKLYVEKHFPPEAKAEADRLVKNLIAAMDQRLANLSWMAPETREKARAKLAAFTPKIGYPDTWRDYSKLQIKRGDAVGNAHRAALFEYERNLGKLGKPVDRGEWFMPPMMVNAYANPTMNEIVFPAAILQPPFFDPNADPAINYGGIGAVIGHEISHHFDDQGRKYDKTGKLTDWWTEEDVKRFKAHADKLVAQYAEYEPLPGMKVNGQLTLGENIADLAGLLVAWDAYKLSLGDEPAPVLEGFSGDQRFFLGHAQIWRTKYREAELRQRLVTDPHTPGHFRPNVIRNIDAWYGAFEIPETAALYLPPEERVRIW